jgi:hypothetical protein
MAIFALACFIGAMYFPSIGTCYKDSESITWFDNVTVVWWGWGGLFFGQYGWYANIPFAIGLISLILGRRFYSYIIPSIQIILFLWAIMPIPLAHNEGYSERVCAHGSGFWLWIGAQALVAMGTIAVIAIARKRGENGEHDAI